MQCWYFDKYEIRHTPSHNDGMSHEEEANLRRVGARLLVQVAVDMNLPYSTWATGSVFFHRFFMRNSFKKYNYIAAAACCLFLAGKIEETPKKCRDIVKGFEKRIEENEQAEAQPEAGRATQKRNMLAELGADPKSTILRYERVLLQTIMFDLQVDNPYKMLLDFAKRIKGDKRKIERVVQIAWTFINDSLCTTLCVEWEPEIVACSLLYLACRSAKFDIVDWEGREEDSKPSPSQSSATAKCPWLDAFCPGLSVELAEEICHSVLDYYAWLTKQQSQPANSSQAAAGSSQPQTASGQQPAAGNSTQPNDSHAANSTTNASPGELAKAVPVHSGLPSNVQQGAVQGAHPHLTHPQSQLTSVSAGSSPKRPRRENDAPDAAVLRPPSLMNLEITPVTSVRPPFTVVGPPQSAPATVAWSVAPRFSAPTAFNVAPSFNVETLPAYAPQQFGTAFPQVATQQPNAANVRFVAEPYARREAHRGTVPSGHR